MVFTHNESIELQLFNSNSEHSSKSKQNYFYINFQKEFQFQIPVQPNEFSRFIYPISQAQINEPGVLRQYSFFKHNSFP